MNLYQVTGRLTKDPVLKGTDEKPVCYFTVASNRSFTNNDGEREADFIDIKVFKNQAKNCHKYLTKGSLVEVEASVRTGTRDIDGKKVKTIDFIAKSVGFLEIKKDNSNDDSANPNNTIEDGPFAGSTETDDPWPFG